MVKIVSTILEDRFKKYNIEIPDDFNFTFIKRPILEEDLINAIKDAEFLLVNSTHEVSKKVIESAPNLKMIHTNGVGYDKVDVKTASKHNVMVVNNKAVNNISVAELTICLIIEGLRRCATLQNYIYDEYLNATHKVNSYNQRELANKVVGLIGLGDIGKEVAKRLNAFNTKILYYKRNPLSKEEENKYNITYASLEDLLKQSDIISLHIPANNDTRHMINKEAISLMKKSAIIINTGRGELIDQDALIEALENDLIYGACLDVCTPEPLPKDNPLLNMSKEARDKLLITPHIGGNTYEANSRSISWIIEDIKKYLEGKEIENIINKDILK